MKGIFKQLYFSREKDKFLDIEILPSFTTEDILMNYRDDISYLNNDQFSNKELNDEDNPKQYKFIVTSEKNPNVEFVIGKTQNVTKILQENEPAELFYIPIDSNSYNINNTLSSAMMFQSEYSKMKHEPILDSKFIETVLLKEEKNLMEFSLSTGAFESIDLAFYSSYLKKTIKKKNENENVKEIISIGDIISAEETKEIVYNDGKKSFFTMLLLTPQPEVKYYIIFQKKTSLDSWLKVLNSQISLCKCIKVCNTLSVKIFNTSKNIQNNFTKMSISLQTLNGILNYNYTRQIFYSLFEDNKNINLIIDVISKYKSNISNRNFFDGWLNFEEIINFVSRNKDIIKVKDEALKNFAELRIKCKEIMMTTQNENVKEKNELKRQGTLNNNLGTLLDTKLFDGIYNDILSGVYKKKFDEILANPEDPKHVDFWDKVNWFFGVIEEKENDFTVEHFYNIKDCLGDLIIKDIN